MDDSKGAQFLLHSNFRVFSKAITTLSRISEDVLFDVGEHGLHLKSINRSKSAYGVFRFTPTFFAEVDLGTIEREKSNICRLSMKAALDISKGVKFNDTNFVSCSFNVDPKSDTMRWKIEFHYGVIRQLILKLLENPRHSFRPRVDKDLYQNMTILSPSILSPILDQMKGNTELNMCVDENGITFKNFEVDDAGVLRSLQSTFLGAGPAKVQRKLSEAHVGMDKFERHDVNRPTDLVFSIREFVAFVSFAEGLGTDVSLYYDIPGRPMYISVEGHTSFNADLMLATVTNDPEIDVDGGLDMTLEQLEVEETTRRRKSNTSSSPSPNVKRKKQKRRVLTEDHEVQAETSKRNEVPIEEVVIVEPEAQLTQPPIEHQMDEAAVEPEVQDVPEENIPPEELATAVEPHVDEVMGVRQLSEKPIYDDSGDQNLPEDEDMNEPEALHEPPLTPIPEEPCQIQNPEITVEKENVDDQKPESQPQSQKVIFLDEAMEFYDPETPKKVVVTKLTNAREEFEMSAKLTELQMTQSMPTITFVDEEIPDSVKRPSLRNRISSRNFRLIRILIGAQVPPSSTDSQVIADSVIVTDSL